MLYGLLSACAPVGPRSRQLKEVPGRFLCENSAVSWKKSVLFKVFGITEGIWQVKKKKTGRSS